MNITVFTVHLVCVVLMACMYGFRRGHACALQGKVFNETSHDRVTWILFAVAVVCLWVQR